LVSITGHARPREVHDLFFFSYPNQIPLCHESMDA